MFFRKIAKTSSRNGVVGFRAICLRCVRWLPSSSKDCEHAVLLCYGFLKQRGCSLRASLHRQLRDVAICPHEKGIVSYARNFSIVEHDLITPNAVRTLPLVREGHRCSRCVPVSTATGRSQFHTEHGFRLDSPRHWRHAPGGWRPGGRTPSLLLSILRHFNIGDIIPLDPYLFAWIWSAAMGEQVHPRSRFDQQLRHAHVHELLALAPECSGTTHCRQ